MASARAMLPLLAFAALVTTAAAVPAAWPGVATSQLQVAITPSFLSSGVVTFNMAVQKTFAADSARFVFHGVSAQPSSPTWSSWFNSNNFNSNKCSYEAVLTEQGTFAAGGVVAATTGDFDLNAFCTQQPCPGSLVQDCGFSATAGVLNPDNLRYAGKAEIWLSNAAHELLIGFYDIAIELPLNAQAVAGDSLPITVTLNTDLVTVDTTVTGLGLLKSYLMLCPGQDVPQQLGGNTIGQLTDASTVTNVFVGETYCLRHVVPSLPSGVRLTNHQLFSNGTEVPTVPAFTGTGLLAFTNFTVGVPTYGSMVEFYYTFTDRGLSTFSSTVNFTAAAARFLALAPSSQFTYVSLPLTGGASLAAGATRISTALRVASSGDAARGAARGLLESSNTYAQASAQAFFSPLAKDESTPPPPPVVDPVPASDIFGSFN